jgi:hypothetical protein
MAMDRSFFQAANIDILMKKILHGLADIIDGTFGLVTQITSTTTGVTLNKTKGIITTFSQSAAAGVSAAFTVTNSNVAAASNIRAYVIDYAGTFTTNGIPVVSVDNRTAGTFDIVVSNAHGANALSGALQIGFEIVS